MEWERIRANWPHYQGLAQARWAEISARELQMIDGQRDVLAGHISVVYNITPLAAQMQLEAWQGQLADSDPPG
jgi:uncharacterized protein YjbJ (UPF0337 family)